MPSLSRLEGPLGRVLLGAALLLFVAGASEPAGKDEPSPFTRTDVGAETLVFHRPAADGSGTEGFVIDTRRLVETLKARVLEARGLGEVVDVQTAPRSSRDYGGPEPGAYRHTFAAPFDTVTTTLRLAPLKEPDEGALLSYLALVLAVCVVGGLFALYRMVESQILFAAQRSDFVSAVSHELRTPLTSIRMYGEMLHEDLVPDEAKRREYYRTITAESERLTRLVNNVLELSNLERRSRPVNAVVGDVRDVVEEALTVLRPHAEEQGVTLSLVVDEGLPRVAFDADALRQVTFNLIDNALKYGGSADDKRVVVHCSGTPQGVRISVRDFGPGVAADELEAIFAPFYRGERELTRSHRGTGIGLSLVRGLVEAMQGTVVARNAAPGLEIVVELPRAAERALRG